VYESYERHMSECIEDLQLNRFIPGFVFDVGRRRRGVIGSIVDTIANSQ